jgi:hypothetical protein
MSCLIDSFYVRITNSEIFTIAWMMVPTCEALLLVFQSVFYAVL